MLCAFNCYPIILTAVFAVLLHLPVLVCFDNAFLFFVLRLLMKIFERPVNVISLRNATGFLL